MSTPTLPELLARHHALALAYVDGVLRILRGCEARAYNQGTDTEPLSPEVTDLSPERVTSHRGPLPSSA